MARHPSSKDTGSTVPQPDMSLGLSQGKVRHEREPEKREFDLRLFRRMFSYTAPYRRQRNLLFLIVLLRGIQIPTIGWGISAVINGPIASNDWGGTIIGSFVFLAFCAFTQWTMHYRQLIALRLGEAAVFDMRRDVFSIS